MWLYPCVRRTNLAVISIKALASGETGVERASGSLWNESSWEKWWLLHHGNGSPGGQEGKATRDAAVESGDLGQLLPVAANGLEGGFSEVF